MKKKFILLPLVALMCYAGLLSNSSGPGAMGAGDRTLASTKAGCGGIGCHGTTSGLKFAVSLVDLSGFSVTSYVPGTAYKIRLYGANPGSTILARFGFQAAAVQSGTATSVGTLSTITGAHLGTYPTSIVEHSSPFPVTTGLGGLGSTYEVDIPWTAPIAGTGAVDIQGVLNAVNAVSGADAGDLWAHGLVTVPEFIPAFPPITGTLTVCVGASTKLSHSTSGGSWSSGTTGVATVGTSGLVTGVTPGTSVIKYTVGASSSSATVTVITTPTVAPITGAADVCIAKTISLTTTSTGGVWSSGATSKATVSGAGIVSGVATGTAVISYTMTNTCGSSSATATVNIINTKPTPAAITGASVTCVSKTTTLSNATPGGVWSSGATTIATVSSGGVVSGVATGTATISYKVSNSCGDSTVTKVLTIKAVGACATGAGSVTAVSGTELKVYPNPNNGTFTFNLLSENSTPAHVVVTNIIGATVAEFTTVTNKATDVRIDRPAGIYLLTARTSSGVYVSRISVQ